KGKRSKNTSENVKIRQKTSRYVKIRQTSKNTIDVLGGLEKNFSSRPPRKAVPRDVQKSPNAVTASHIWSSDLPYMVISLVTTGKYDKIRSERTIKRKIR